MNRVMAPGRSGTTAQGALESARALYVAITRAKTACIVSFADERFVSMFLDEARITAKLSHPNVCEVYELGRADNRYFIAMPYLRPKGRKLRFGSENWAWELSRWSLAITGSLCIVVLLFSLEWTLRRRWGLR